MKSKLLLAAGLLIASLFLIPLSLSNVSCNGKDKKDGDKKEIADGMVPKIDTASLKDEPSILDAMQKVVDARLADDKKKNEDPNYAGHYLELTKLYTAVLKASTAYSKTMTDPNMALEFDKKVSAIQDKMYAK